MRQDEAREMILKEVLELKGTNYLFELATGVGKSKLALDKTKQLCFQESTPENSKLLIVVNRNIHKKNWEDEINKWWPDCNLSIYFTTYVSLPKYKGDWNIVIFDEAHHLSKRCLEALCNFNITHSILLSATVKQSLKNELIEVFNDISFLKIDLRDAIDDGILPDPKVYLIPLKLKDDFPTESIWRNPKAKGKLINCSWAERWNYIRQNTNPVRIFCTEKQYIQDLNNQIEWWKNRYMQTRNERVKTKWLRLCSDRLKYLSEKKNSIIKSILALFKDKRILTFCSDIKQTEILGHNCINSKNTDSAKYLENFNNGKINHITACNMLNEGMNLTNCQIGIYANLNSSDIIVKQRAGRLLRHTNPIIIIPYYIGTREEELVNKMLENYNSELVSSISCIKDMVI